MNNYIELKVLPDPEFVETVLMNAVYAKLHRVLMGVGSGGVGVSFPTFKKTLGNTLRIHGDESSLEELLVKPWLKGLRDYTDISGVLNVPTKVKYRVVKHKRVKSAYNKRKRSIAKGWLTEDEALQKIPDSKERCLTLPYAQMRSLSTNSLMRVYVEHGVITENPTFGKFSSYGLSKTATVPWF